MEVLEPLHEPLPREMPAGLPERLGEDGRGSAGERPGAGVALSRARACLDGGERVARAGPLHWRPRRIREEHLSVEEQGRRGGGSRRERPRREDPGRPPQPLRRGGEGREFPIVAEEEDGFRFPGAQARDERLVHLATAAPAAPPPATRAPARPPGRTRRRARRATRARAASALPPAAAARLRRTAARPARAFGH